MWAFHFEFFVLLQWGNVWGGQEGRGFGDLFSVGGGWQWEGKEKCFELGANAKWMSLGGVMGGRCRSWTEVSWGFLGFVFWGMDSLLCWIVLCTNERKRIRVWWRKYSFFLSKKKKIVHFNNQSLNSECCSLKILIFFLQTVICQILESFVSKPY